MALESLLGMLIPFVLAIVFIRTVAEMHGRHMRLREKRLGLADDAAPQLAARQSEYTRELEARVRVLERLVTDRGPELAREIEDLRKERV